MDLSQIYLAVLERVLLDISKLFCFSVFKTKPLNKYIESLYLLTVFLTIPLNELPCSSLLSNSNSHLAKRRKLSRHSEHSGIINGITTNSIGGKMMGSQPSGVGLNLSTSSASTRPPPLTLGMYTAKGINVAQPKPGDKG